MSVLENKMLGSRASKFKIAATSIKEGIANSQKDRKKSVAVRVCCQQIGLVYIRNRPIGLAWHLI